MACLELISLSRLSLERAGGSFDLVFDLSSKPLPAFSAIDCWRGRCISPLRDRTMIQWLCSNHVTESILKEMLMQINQALKERTSSGSLSKETPASDTTTTAGSVSLQVGVACQNGAQHSVCFVERLYEKYSSESALELVGGVRVTVERKHCEATKGEWLHTKEPVWQHSKLVANHLTNQKELLLNRSWSNFQDDISHQIEAGFCADPFSVKVDVGKHIVDFQRGIVYNKRSRQEFKVRSTIPRLEGKVKSTWVQERGRKEFFCGAGILFYSVHPRTGEPVFLLGHMTYSCMSWCDFGGMKDHGERPRLTAARECFEETLGVLGTTDDLLTSLENNKENNVFEIKNENTKYVGHYLRVPYKDYPSEFEQALRKKAGHKEVNEIRWFSLSCLRRGIHKALLDQYDLTVPSLNKDGSIATAQRLPLRSEFVRSLCIAEQLGVLKSIEHIATAQRTGAGERHPSSSATHSKHRPEDTASVGMSKDAESATKDLDKLELSPATSEEPEEGTARHCSRAVAVERPGQEPAASMPTDCVPKSSRTPASCRLYGVGSGTFLT